MSYLRESAAFIQRRPARRQRDAAEYTIPGHFIAVEIYPIVPPFSQRAMALIAAPLDSDIL